MAAKQRRKKRSQPKSGPLPNQPRPPVSSSQPSDEWSETLAEEDVSGRDLGQVEVPVAGLVASAGGLDAFKRFFTVMPADSGIAFVLVPHLDPSHASLMVELLARQTAMPVVEAVNGMAIEANQVHIIPPNKNMTIEGGVLRLTGPVERGGWQTSIDLFLRSLAEDQMHNAICIILSGTGSHGTLGLKAVKAAGGMAMVQDPTTAECSGMPKSAIATGLADYVLPVEKMPEVILKYVQQIFVSGGERVTAVEKSPDDLNQLLAILRARTKFDFRSYRKGMLARRLERRLRLSHFDNVADFVAHLREHPDEVKQLARDLLISVTRFFRDPEAFHILENEVIAPLVQAKDSDGPLRVWVPGCATGEEPYAIAMLLLEHQMETQDPRRVQIFATDVDERALEVARRGVYPADISVDVSPERLARFFTQVDESAWQVSKQVREMVTFAVQNLIGDAPFSRMDLISCRNLLIYLEPDVQKKVVALLHFALKKGGYLFLGPSETIGRQIDLFEPVSKKWRIYRRIGLARPNTLQFPMQPTESRNAPARPSSQLPALSRLADLAQTCLLRRLNLAYVVIDRNYEVLHFAGPTEDYLVQPGGPPTQNLISLARQGLESKLRAVVRRAIREDSSQSIRDVKVHHGRDIRRVDIEVEPLDLSKQSAGLLLISFQPQPTPSSDELSDVAARPETEEPEMVRQLELELETTREDLQSTIEELESSNEELKASNEEIMSMNEEIQSANEELESSKEELQSFNEELSTVNNQLHDKIAEVESATNDMANLLNSTDIATVFLDFDLRIKLFTPAATRMFKMIARDRGRPIGDIAKRFDDDGLLPDVEQVLQDLVPRDKEVCNEDGRWFVRRLVPYRTLDNRIDGVVITFSDVTDRKQASDAVDRHLAAIVESSADAIISMDLVGNISTWNRGAEEIYGYRRAEVVGRSINMIIPEHRVAEWTQAMSLLTRGEHAEQFETEHVCKDGRHVVMSLTVSPILDGQGKVVSASVTGRDITERKRAEEALQISEERFRKMASQAQEGEAHLTAILNTAADAVITIDVQGTIQSANPMAERMFGYAAAEMIGQNVNMLMPTPYRAEHDRYLARYKQTGMKYMIGNRREVAGQRKDGSTFPVDLAVSEVDHLNLFTGILRDISQKRELEREVVEIASLEQRRIGQDLHDSVSQELTALSMLAGDLTETLQSDPSKGSHLVDRMVLGLQRCQQELRAVMRGLCPVSVDAEGLTAALSDLASRIQQESKVTCVFDCPDPVLVEDNLIATHLYLIAQEAVHNAVKHARCRNIRISVRSDQLLVVRVEDDGIGIESRSTERHGGLGLCIMRNRAAIIHAMLTIEPAKPVGTVVTCALGRKKNGS